jgi:hypothetical protein
MTTTHDPGPAPVRPGALAAALAAVAAWLAPLAGCGARDDRSGPPVLVPVRGTVRLDGKPLAGAVLTFLPADVKRGTFSVGETDAEGTYKLTYSTSEGTTPGDYRVTVSYLESTQGRPQGISARYSPSYRPEMVGARERLPEEYSTQAKTTLRATVPPTGGTIDFDLKGPMLAPPEPPPATPKSDAPAAAVPVKLVALALALASPEPGDLDAAGPASGWGTPGDGE